MITLESNDRYSAELVKENASEILFLLKEVYQDYFFASFGHGEKIPVETQTIFEAIETMFAKVRETK